MATRARIAPSYINEVSVVPGTINAATATLISTTVAGILPEHVIHVNPTAAIAVGVAVGAPYCVTKGTLVIPFINPTAGNVAVATQNFKIVAF